jgi:hypothetical protein
LSRDGSGFLFVKGWVRILAGTQQILTESFRGLSQSLYVNVGIKVKGKFIPVTDPENL